MKDKIRMLLKELEEQTKEENQIDEEMEVLDFVNKKAREERYSTFDSVPEDVTWNKKFTMGIYSFLTECEFIDGCEVVKETIVDESDHYIEYEVVVQIDDTYVEYSYSSPKDESEMGFYVSSLQYVKPVETVIIDYVPV